MKKRLSKKGFFPLMFTAGMLAIASCAGVDDNYDLGDLDATIGIGGDGISLPTSSTDSIMLSDVLNLSENGDVKTLENGDYVFQMAGKHVTSAHPEVAKVSLNPMAEITNQFRFNISSSAKGTTKAKRVSGHIDETTNLQQMFVFTGHSDVVESLSSIELDPTTISIKLDFSGVESVMPTISQLKLSLPGYLDLSSDDVTSNQSVGIQVSKEKESTSVALSNVSTASTLALTLNLKRIDFTQTTSSSQYGSLSIDKNAHLITLNGKYNVSIQTDWSVDDISSIGSLYLISQVKGETMVIKEATGQFNPDIDFEIGETSVNGIPDFLSDGNVVADLDNPQIRFTIKSDMDVAAKIGGTVDGKKTSIVSSKNGVVLASVDLPEITIKPGTPSNPVTTTICICRDASKLTDTYDEVREISDLSSLIKTIPDAIKVENINARADNNRVSTFVFGRRYTVAPSYEVYAPLAFGEEGCIVYKDTLNNWSVDLEDVTPFIDKNDPSKNTSVELSADIVSRIPAYLTLSIQPVDKDGKAISSNIIKVTNPETVVASDGKKLVTSPVAANMTLMTEDALDVLDGVIMTISGSANGKNGAVTGVTLNAKTQKMKVENLKIKLIGKVVADLN